MLIKKGAREATLPDDLCDNGKLQLTMSETALFLELRNKLNQNPSHGKRERYLRLRLAHNLRDYDKASTNERKSEILSEIRVVTRMLMNSFEYRLTRPGGQA